MAARGLSGALLAAVLTLAGCSGGAAVTSVPAPTPTYTQAQADACTFAAASIDFGAQAPSAEHLYSSGSGDLSVARKEATTAAEKDAPLVATFTGTGADAEVAALYAALVAGGAAFGRPMTIDQFDAAYKAINEASYAFRGRCREIGNWVQRKRPMG
jgi:hypothetical protein